MLKLIDSNYYRLVLTYIIFLATYCMTGLIVPIQFVVSSTILKFLFIFLALIIASYNFFIKKIYKKVVDLNYLILFLVINFTHIILLNKYGYSNNIKDTIIFFIYFFSIYSTYFIFEKEEIKKLVKVFFLTIAVFNTVAVIYSLVQFFMLRGYKVLDYRGHIVRQGFLESRLFGIFTDPNIASIVTIIVTIYVITIIRQDINSYSLYFIIFVNYLYIIFSGSRTAYLTLLVLLITNGSKNIFLKANKRAYFIKLLASILILITSYSSIKFLSNQYLSIKKDDIRFEESIDVKEIELSLDRKDTTEENISNNRFKIWSSTLQLVPKRILLGYSSGNWHEIGKETSPENYVVKEKYQPHNGYIEILFYNGIIGFIILAIYFIKSLIRLVKLLKINNNYIDFSLYTIVVILFANLFVSATLYGINILGFVLFTVIAIINNLYKETVK